jgi:hypothetical protein
MEVYISINGVLRDLIQKFEYHYNNNFIDTEVTVDEDTVPFDYRITHPLRNDNLLNSFAFQSKEEFNNFLFVDYPLEIFGHSTLSYPTVIMDLNKLIYENQDINFTIIGLDEYGKAKPSTLFFLSKYSFMGNNIKFIKSDDISKEWKKCDIWITDNYDIIEQCPNTKTAVKFITDYNYYFTHKNETKKIDLQCLKSSEPTTTSTLTRLLKYAVLSIRLKKRTKLS